MSTENTCYRLGLQISHKDLHLVVTMRRIDLTLAQPWYTLSVPCTAGRMKSSGLLIVVKNGLGKEGWVIRTRRRGYRGRRRKQVKEMRKEMSQRETERYDSFAGIYRQACTHIGIRGGLWSRTLRCGTPHRSPQNMRRNPRASKDRLPLDAGAPWHWEASRGSPQQTLKRRGEWMEIRNKKTK